MTTTTNPAAAAAYGRQVFLQTIGCVRAHISKRVEASEELREKEQVLVIEKEQEDVGERKGHRQVNRMELLCT